MDELDDLDDDETVYRRIPVRQSGYDPGQDEVKPEAFKPIKYDTTGLSVSRSRSKKNPNFFTVAEAARGTSSHGYYVASLSVGNLRSHGIKVVPKPLPENLGHAEIPNLTYENRKDEASQSLMVLIAHKLVDSVEGPFRT